MREAGYRVQVGPDPVYCRTGPDLEAVLAGVAARVADGETLKLTVRRVRLTPAEWDVLTDWRMTPAEKP